MGLLQDPEHLALCLPQSGHAINICPKKEIMEVQMNGRLPVSTAVSRGPLAWPGKVLGDSPDARVSRGSWVGMGPAGPGQARGQRLGL